MQAFLRREDCMSKDSIVRKNLELLEEFMKYSFEHPEILENVPKDAQIIILPENDTEVLQANREIVEECKRDKRTYVVFRMALPQRSIPHLEDAS